MSDYGHIGEDQSPDEIAAQVEAADRAERCGHSLEQWSREYLRRTAEDQGANPDTASVAAWIDSEASAMSDDLADTVDAYMSHQAMPIPGEDDE